MKFSEFVLSEGRKEDILKKYMEDFDIQVLDRVLNDPFTKSSNYKYADWILKKLEFNSLPLAIEVLELVKQFDRVGKNLEIKDINQYPDVVELRAAIEDYSSKSQEKKVDSEAKKIYEDGRILIVKPLSHKASCKYGAGTKWCTTQASPGYYDKYTTGNQGLYYIIMKDFDISNKFYKIALHRGDYNVDTWYDAHDTPMPPREVDVLKVGLGKRATKAIEDDFNENKNKVIKELFNPKNHDHTVVTYDLFNSKKPLTLEFKNPQIVDDSAGLADMDLIIYLGNEDNEQIIEQGSLKISYSNLSGNDSYSFDIVYEPSDDFEPPAEFTSLWNMDVNFGLNFSKPTIPPFKYFCNILISHIWSRFERDKNLQNFVLGGKKSWNPNRHSYGFTFERKGGLINKLVDYIDSGKEGNAIDFLIDAGKVTTRKLNNGKIEYIGKKGPITTKGYFSAFFASAVQAGILRYERKNKKNILTKGPNFDDFKEGNLAAL
jgi:hypothetical protein